MSWTQAICHDCWDEKHPSKPSPGGANGPEETCSYCGVLTHSGIYVRDDPTEVPYPREDTP